MEKDSELIIAIRFGQIKVVRKIVKCGANLEEISTLGYTPLMEAVRERRMDMMSLFVRRGANVNAVSIETRETALTLASSCGLTNFVGYLINAGANTQLGICTPLMDASSQGKYETVKFLINYTDCEIDAKTPKGRTALTFACEKNHWNVAEILLENGANIEKESGGGQTALMIASGLGHLQTVQLLISWKANVNHVSRDKSSALCKACANGNWQVVWTLLENSAEIEHGSKDGLTPLMIACRSGHLSTVMLLVSKGAVVNRETTSKSSTPLSLACYTGRKKIVKFLLSMTNADPYMKLANNSTMLMETVKGAVKRATTDRSAIKIATLLVDYPRSVLDAAGNGKEINVEEESEDESIL